MIEKDKAALDVLLKDSVDLSTMLTEGGLLKQLTKALMERGRCRTIWGTVDISVRQ